MQYQNTTDNDDTPDPDRIDETAHVHTDHVALDGGDHITPEDIERHEADQWHRNRIADQDESHQPPAQIGEDDPNFVDYIELISWLVPTEVILRLPHDYVGWGGYPVWRRDQIHALLAAAGWEVRA